MRKRKIIALSGIIVVIIVFSAFLVGLGSKTVAIYPTATQEAIVEPVFTTPPLTAAPTANQSMTINIAYGFTLQFPSEYADILIHEQEVYGALVTEAFSMRAGETDIPLFRIDFGDETVGDWFGLLKTEDGIIPVVHTVFVLANNELNSMDESVQEQYFELMNSFNAVLNTIATDPRFTTEKPLAVGENTEMETNYWTLMLPNNMNIVETEENGTYVAMFYAEVAGERTALYTIRIGDDKADFELGLYEVDGIKKPISIDSFDLNGKSNWTEEDYSAAYRMMETINHVIETIMSSTQYSAPDENALQTSKVMP